MRGPSSSRRPAASIGRNPLPIPRGGRWSSTWRPAVASASAATSAPTEPPTTVTASGTEPLPRRAREHIGDATGDFDARLCGRADVALELDQTVVGPTAVSRDAEIEEARPGVECVRDHAFDE